MLMLLLLCLAQTPPTATDVMTEVERRQTAAFRYEGEVTVERPGEPAEHKRWRYQRSGPPGQSRVLLRFLAPAEIRGVALLVWNSPGVPAAAWLYTPALGRTRRVAPQDRGTRLAGTDLSFEDFEDRSRDEWIYSDLSESDQAGERAWRLRARPRQSSSGEYSWIWISQDKWTPLRIDKWDGRRAVRRTLFENFQRPAGHWTPFEITTADLVAGSRTILRLNAASYPAQLPKSDFTLEALRGAW